MNQQTLKWKLTTSALLNPNTRCDTSNEIADKLECQFNNLQKELEGKSEKGVLDFLVSSAKDPNYNELFSGGFLFGILTDPQNALKHFTNLGHSQTGVADNQPWYQALLKMNMVLLEIFYKVKPSIRQQILFFFSEGIKNNVPKIDNVLTNLMRTLCDGSEYKETCMVVLGIAEILLAHKEWTRALKPQSTFPPIALMTFSRFLSDHQQLGNFNNNDGRFKNSLIAICDFLLKERFGDMLILGRDFVLVLMRLSKIPQFVSFWRSLIHNPQTITPNFRGVPQLMAMPPSPQALSFRVSLHVGRRVDFILKMGQKALAQSCHLDWLAKGVLSNSDSGSLRAEVMRHVWYNIQEFQTAAAIETRAYFLAWLITGAKAGTEAQWCKLMLFFDWLGFDNQPATLIFVEPAFSVIRLLLNTNPLLANSLVDFVMRISSTFHPPLATYFANCITTALVSLGVAGMPIISVLDRLDKPLKDSFREAFPGVFARKANSMPELQSPAIEQTIVLESGTVKQQPATPEPTASTSTAPIPKEKVKKKHLKRKISSDIESGDEQISKPKEIEILEIIDEDDEDGAEQQPLSVLLPMLKEEFREHLEALDAALKQNNGNDEAGDAMSNLLTAITYEDDELENEQTEVIAECFQYIFNPLFRRKRHFPADDPSPETLADVFDKSPFYAMFRQLCLLGENEAAKESLLLILSNMTDKCIRLGYLFLFFIRCGGKEYNVDFGVSAYLELGKMCKKSVDSQLCQDLQQCAMDDHKLFAFLLPFIFDKLSTHTIGSVELMHLVCRCIDSRELGELIGEIVVENIVLFRRDSFPTLLNNSLAWETVEQMILWHLIRAEGVPIEWVLGIVPQLNYSKHTETATNVLLMLKSMDHEPNMAVLRNLMCRSAKDLFVVHALKILIDDEDNLVRVAQLMNSLMKKAINANEIMNASFTGQSAPKQKSKRPITVDNIFSHLDQFRSNCLTKDSKKAEAFLANSFLQEMFSLTKKDSRLNDIRQKYSELHAIMEIMSDLSGNRRKNRNRNTEKEEAIDTKVKRRKIKNDPSDED